MRCATGHDENLPGGYEGSPDIVSCGWLAWALAFVGDFDRSRAWAEGGVERADAAGLPQAQAPTYVFRGFASVERGDFAEALPWLQRAFELSQQKGLVFWLPLAYTGYGMVLAWSGRTAEGVSHLEKSVTMSESLRVKAGLSQHCLSLAGALVIAGRLADARRRPSERSTAPATPGRSRPPTPTWGQRQ